MQFKETYTLFVTLKVVQHQFVIVNDFNLTW